MKQGEHLKGVGNPNGAATFRVNGINAQFEDSFVNAKDPQAFIRHEKPWHRLAAFMAAQGKLASEIAVKLGRTDAQVNEVLKQPFVQERILNEIHEAGRGVLDDILNIYGPNSLLEVVDLGQSAKSESVKLAAHKEVLDRWLGKAKESMVIEQKAPEDKTDDELRASVNTILGGLGRPEGVSGETAG